jgi:antitoxin ChpS
LSTVRIRKQGGAAIMTIPSAALKALRLDVGSTVEVDVRGGALVARPATKPARKRYSLRQLLKGATPAAMRKLNAETEWARDGDPVGREI